MAEKKIYYPTKDIIFKLLFNSKGNEEITQSFIQWAVNDDVGSVTLNHSLDLDIHAPNDKQMKLDVLVKDEIGRKYLLEMQRKSHPGETQRFVLYCCKEYSKGLEVGGKYTDLKQTTLIVVMEEPFRDLKPVEKYHSVMDLAIKEHTELEFENVIRIHIIELSKYKEQKNNGGKIEPWLEFIINPLEKEVEKMARTDKALRDAVELFKRLNADEEVRRIAEMEELAEAEREQELASSMETGLEIGRAEGEKLGLKRGKEMGRAEGEKLGIEKGSSAEKKNIAKKLMMQNIDIEIIKITTGLSDTELEKLAV